MKSIFKSRISLGFLSGIILVGAIAGLVVWPSKAASRPIQPVVTISRPAFFAQPIQAVGSDPQAAADAPLLQLAMQLSGGKPDELAETLELFLNENPRSPWAPSLRINLGKYYLTQGQYTLALKHWETAWELTRPYNDGPGKRIADYAFAHWTRLLASLGRMEELTLLFNETKGRPLDGGPNAVMVSRTTEAYKMMVKSPRESFKCGLLALNNVAQALYGRKIDSTALMSVRAPENAFSLQALTEVAQQFQLGLVAVERVAGDDIVVPSLVHWKQNHYAAIVGQRDGVYEVKDPTFGYVQYLTAKAINQESSGKYLIPQKLISSSWRALAPDEAGTVFGRGLPYYIDDTRDQNCSDSCNCPPGGNGGSGDCNGMPAWHVSEPYINVWIEDKPLY